MNHIKIFFNLLKSNNVEFLRMLHWLIFSALAYFFAMYLASKGMDFYPQIQTISWKIGHLTVASFLGYWIDRNVFRDRITKDSPPLVNIRRAIIIVGTMIAISLGM